MPKVCAIIITFQPNCRHLIDLVVSLLRQCEKIYIVYNTEPLDDSVFECLLGLSYNSEKVSMLRLGSNLGIATAINIGIKEALAESPNFILLSDQDSLPADDMVLNLLLAYENLARSNLKIGAVGPTFTDLYTKITYPFQVELPKHFFY